MFPNRSHWMKLRLRTVAVFFAFALAALPALGAETGLLVESVRDDTEGQIIELFVGRSTLIKPPWMVSRISVADPEVAEVQVLTPSEVLVIGKAAGATDLYLWSEEDEMLRGRIFVEIDVQGLQDALDRLFPELNLGLTRSQNLSVITGEIQTAEQAENLHKYLDRSGVDYVDMTRMAGVPQVLLEVRFAEVDRSAIKIMGVNFFRIGQDFFGGSLIGSASGGPINPFQIGAPKNALVNALDPITRVPDIPFQFLEDTTVSPAVTLLAGFPRAELEVFIQALVENQYIRILAEPTLVALSGEEASFLAGGEFPIPVVQSSSGGGTSITVEYKEFGVRLSFLPVVMGENSIRLRVSPEVSSISDVGAVQIQGFRIPGILTRRAETTLDLKSGQTFAMAGLLNETISTRDSRIPFLGDLPVLGTLFRSTRYEKNETELVVLVTASVVMPLSPAGPKPMLDAHYEPPNDWEFFSQGRIQSRAANEAPSAPDPVEQLGLRRLKGPGAWDTSSSPFPASRAQGKPAGSVQGVWDTNGSPFPVNQAQGAPAGSVQISSETGKMESVK